MSNAATTFLARQIGVLYTGGSATGLSDRQLIEQFVARNDPSAVESAFAALVARHGAMVLSVCRQLLGNAQLAEDAFQAVFLVLARRARSIRDPDLLAPWLYGVALRTARKARARENRLRRGDEARALRPDVTVEDTPVDRPILELERAEALHAEIDRLPASARAPIVLCYFEGLTLSEAAQRLRCPAGTVHSRLDRAKARLRLGLIRRGISLSTTAMAGVLTNQSARACVSPLLNESTTMAAIRFAAHAITSAPAPATTLARDVLKTMLARKLKAIAAALLLVAAAGGYHAILEKRGVRAEGRVPTGGGAPAYHSPLATRHSPLPGPNSPLATRHSPLPGSEPGRMLVTGRVLDSQGRPIAGASVGVHSRRRLLFAPMGSEGVYPALMGQATTDPQGRFRLEAARTSSVRHSQFGAVAIAPGYGVAWAELDPDEDQPLADIVLPPEQIVKGRLFDVNGRPAGGVTVSVSAVWRTLPVPPLMTAQGRAIDVTEGLAFWLGRIQDRPGWPRPVTTDVEGRFTLRGIGRGFHANLNIRDPRFAPQSIEFAADAPATMPDGVQTLKWTLQPVRTLAGRATYADTGKPVVHGRLTVGSTDDEGVLRITHGATDANGRFRVSLMPGRRVSIGVAPPAGQPYLAVGSELQWPSGAVEQSVDLVLKQGIWLRGKVVEAGSGKPVADAMVRFNGHGEQRTGGLCQTAADGTYAMAVAPGPGCLSVQAADDEYALRSMSSYQLYHGKNGGVRVYAHAFVMCAAPKPGTDAIEVNVALRRTNPARLELIGPDGHSVRDIWVFSRIVLRASAISGVRTWRFGYHDVARHGQYELHALDPDAETSVHFLEPKSKLGATVRLTAGSDHTGPIPVRLEPCGQAVARLVDPQGRPVAGPVGRLSVKMVVTPGPTVGSAQENGGAVAADEATLNRVDPVNYATPLAADASGRMILPVLIPGATYRIIDSTGGSVEVRKEFVAAAGQAIELGDILIAKPPGPH